MRFLLQGVKVLLLAALICAVVLIGFIVWNWSFGQPVERYLTSAESAYGAGAASFNSRDADKAEQSFNDAMLHANKALETLGKKADAAKESGTERKPEEIAAENQQRAQAVYVKVRSQAGLEFTKFLKENKPLPFPPDAPEDKKTLDQLSYARIPDAAIRADIREGLAKAAKFMPENKELLKDALRNEITMDPPNWPLVKEFAENLLNAGEPDERALYQLARYEFEQPIESITKESLRDFKATAIEKRNKDRVAKALDHVTRLSEVEGANRRLRSIALEANIRNWLLQHASQADRAKPEVAKVQAERLRALLFDESTGALHRAAQDTMLNKLSRMDLQGVLALHQLAMDRTIEDGKTQAGAGRTSDQVLQVLTATLAYCSRLAGSPDATAPQISDAFELAVTSSQKAQPYLSKDHPEAWKAQLAALDSLKQKATEKKVTNTKAYLHFADLFSTEAGYLGKKGQSSQQSQLQAKADQAIKEGMSLTDGQGADQALPLHIVAVRTKLFANPARAEIDESMRVLQQSQHPAAQSTYHLAEGMFAIREGKLEKAIQELERAIPQADTTVRSIAHASLGQLYFALGRYDKALTSLQEFERSQAGRVNASDEEKAWLKDFISDPHLLDWYILRAELELGSAEYQHMKRLLGPGPKRMSQEFVTKLSSHETDAERRIKKLPAEGPKLRDARQRLVSFLYSTDQRDRADRELQSLKQDFPNSADVVYLEALTLLRNTEDKERIAKADRRMQEFITQHPSDVDGRLLWVGWLSETGRSAQALAYVEDPANFPGKATDPKVSRVRAILHAHAGNRAKLADYIRGSDPNPILSVASLQYLDSDDKSTALNRLQSQPIRTIGQANDALSRKDYKSAIDGYVKTLEYSQLHGIAQQGIGRALLEMANENPGAAKDEAAKVLQQYPHQAGALIAYAYACVLLDEHGDPSKPVTEVVDAASALAILENVLVQKGTDKSTAALVKANVWITAGRLAFARHEIQRALDAGPRNDEALKLSIALAVLMGDAASLSMAERQVAILREVIANPKDADFMHAQVLDKQDRSREAIIAYEALIRDNGTLAKVYLELLPLLERNDMADRAKTWVAYWRNLAPDEILAAQADVRLRCLSGQTADARRVAEQFAAAYVERGKTDVANLRIPPNVDAEKYREAYLQDRLQTADFMMGAAFLKGKAFEDAEAWIQRGLKVKPDAELLQLKLGDIYLAMLQNTSDPMRRTQLAQRAKAEYAKVYTEKKGHSYAGQNLAWLLVKELGDAEEALRIAREVRRGKASNKPISGDRLPLAFLDTLGLIYRNLNKPELFEEMRLLFDDARRTYPTDPRVYLYLGDAYAGLGQTRAADTNYAAAISLSGPRAKTRIPTAELQNILEDANAQRKKLGPRSALK